MNYSENQTIHPSVALYSLSACYFTLAVASLSVIGLLQPMAVGLAVTKSEIAYLVTVFAITYALSAPLVQIWVGHWDRKRLIIIGLTTISLGTAITAAGWQYELVAGGRFLMAIGAAIVGPMASTLGASLVTPSRRGLALGQVFAGLTLATVIGVPLTAAMGTLVGWRAALAAISLLALAAVVLIHLAVPSGSRGERASAREVIDMLTDPILAPAISVTLFQMASQFTTYAVIAAYLLERFEIGSASLPFALMCYGTGGIIGNLIATRFGDQLGADKLIMTSLLLSGLVFLLLQLIDAGLIIGMIMMFCWSVVALMLFAPQQSRLIALKPQSANLLLALNGAAIYVGMAVGAALSGLLYADSGTAYLPMGSLVLIIVALLAYLWSRHRANLAVTSEPSHSG